MAQQGTFIQFKDGRCWGCVEWYAIPMESVLAAREHVKQRYAEWVKRPAADRIGFVPRTFAAFWAGEVGFTLPSGLDGATLSMALYMTIKIRSGEPSLDPDMSRAKILRGFMSADD